MKLQPTLIKEIFLNLIKIAANPLIALRMETKTYGSSSSATEKIKETGLDDRRLKETYIARHQLMNRIKPNEAADHCATRKFQSLATPVKFVDVAKKTQSPSTASLPQIAYLTFNHPPLCLTTAASSDSGFRPWRRHWQQWCYSAVLNSDECNTAREW